MMGGTRPRETSRAQSEVLTQIQTNTAGSWLGDNVVSVCITRHQIVHGRRLPAPWAKTSPVILRDSQCHYQRKLNLSASVLMCWQMRPLCSLQAAQASDVLGAAVEHFLEGFLWLNGNSYCIPVTFSSQSQRLAILRVAWSKAERQWCCSGTVSSDKKN